MVELARLIPAFMSENSEDNLSDVESAISVYGHLLEDRSAVSTAYGKRNGLMFQRKIVLHLHSLHLIEALYFPTILHCCRFWQLCPVTTAEAERMFSKLERTLTAMRSTMGEQKLEALLLIQIHRSDTPSIDDVIIIFSATTSRRLNFIL